MKINITVATFSIMLTIILFTSSIVFAGAPSGWNKDIGDTYFRENSSSIQIDSTAYGTTADIFYHTGWHRDMRPVHSAWELNDAVKPGELGQMSYGVQYTVWENKYVPNDLELFYSGASYKGNGVKVLKTKVWTSGEGFVNAKVQSTLITVNRGAELTWDWALSSDYDVYSDSTVELDFSDNDYEQVSIPSADSTTRVESDNGHIVDIYTNAANDIIYITIVEIGSSVTCETTINLE